MSVWSWVVVIFLACTFIERVAQSFERQATVPGEQRMRWSLYALYALYTLNVFGSLLEQVCWRKGVTVWVSVLGVLLYTGSLILRRVAIRTLGKFWSLQVEIREQHQLVREGVYGFVRHPIYAAIILEVVSLPLVANAWWVLCLVSTSHILMILLRMKREEQEMVGQLGAAYRAYQQEVGALLPRWSWGQRARQIPGAGS
jgi:protein-S-isoprenylcysteine O-methyltransferase Ste14